MAILKGGRERIQQDLSKLGLDVVVVHNLMPDLGPVFKSRSLSMSHLEQIRNELRGDVRAVAPAVHKRHSASFPPGAASRTATVIGTTAEFARTLHLGMKEGRFFRDEEVSQNVPVCVMDSAMANDLLGKGRATGKELEIARGKSRWRLKVVGVVEDPFTIRKASGPIDTVAMSRAVFPSRLEFKNIYVPLGLIWQQGDTIDTVLIRVKDADLVERAMEKLDTIFNPKEGYVVVVSQKEWILETLRSLHDFTGYSNVIWIVIIAVAAVMITTIRLLSVRERYREIAIRRTEGATKTSVGLQFGLEGVLLCATGGLIGIGLGIGLAKLVEASIIRWHVIFSASSILIAAAVSIAVGIASSILPAKRAASLEPVEVLRMS
jgi:putative ABC transport system permease protein